MEGNITANYQLFQRLALSGKSVFMVGWVSNLASSVLPEGSCPPLDAQLPRFTMRFCNQVLMISNFQKAQVAHTLQQVCL